MSVSADGRWSLLVGDCLDVMRAVPDASADSLVTDPPAGIGFMNRGWDSDKGGRAQWVAWLAEVLRECLRVLKPGAHALVWALPRTSHWTATAIEDAGFDIRDRIQHFFSTGFPKSLSVSKAIDARAGAKQKIKRDGAYGKGVGSAGTYGDGLNVNLAARPTTEPAPSQALLWDGHGTALKPAAEDWWLARKPLDGTTAANVLKHGTGALCIDECRIGVADDDRAALADAGAWARDVSLARPGTGLSGSADGSLNRATKGAEYHEAGRWPANIVLSHLEECVEVRGSRGNRQRFPRARSPGGISTTGHRGQRDLPDRRVSEPARYECAPGCPVAELDRQSGAVGAAAPVTGREPGGPGFGGTTYGAPGAGYGAHQFYGDSGGASRFFYCPKSSTAERDAGLDDLPVITPGALTDRKEGSKGVRNPRAGASSSAGGGRRNPHPTVKSVSLMRWLVRLVTPPGGLCLDPFAGSGSTGCGALMDGRRFLGIEREAQYADVAERRLRYAASRPVGGDYLPDPGPKVDPRQGSLF